MEIIFDEPILDGPIQGKSTKVYADNQYIGDVQLDLCVIRWAFLTDSKQGKQNLRDMNFKDVLENMMDYVFKRHFMMMSMSEDIDVYGDETFEEVMEEKKFILDNGYYVNFICDESEAV